MFLVDGDRSPALVNDYQVEGYPTVVFLENGRKVKALVGPSSAELRAKAERFLR